MKGNVPRPRWPAPAAKTATTHPKTSTADLKALAEPRIDPSNQITTLAIVEESVLARTRGYDPYNKSVPGQRRPVDAWQRKRKRD
jgi:hypothetical protein